MHGWERVVAPSASQPDGAGEPTNARRLLTGEWFFARLAPRMQRRFPPPRGVSQGRVYRHELPAHEGQMREHRNLAFLHPERFLLADDLYLLSLLERSPEVPQLTRELLEPQPGGNRSSLAEELAPYFAKSPADLPPTDRLRDAILGVLAENGGLTCAGLIDLFRLELTSFGMVALAGLLRRAAPHPRGLQRTLATACLPIEPRDIRAPLTAAEVGSDLDPRWLDVLLEGAPIPAPSALPVLSTARLIARPHVARGVLARHHCVAIQHVLATNLTLFRALVEDGLQPEKTEIIGVPYSTNYVVQHGLRRAGIRTNTPDLVDPAILDATLRAAAHAAISRALARPGEERILIVDDGGAALATAARSFPHAAHRFVGVEQTTRGVTELGRLEPLPFPVIDVARCPLKQHERATIGGEVVRAVARITARIGMQVIEGRRAGVLGYGVIGESVARALADAGAHVVVFDRDPAASARARAHGFEVAEERNALLGSVALLIGATGHRSITRCELARLPHECVVGSASSRDVEIDLSPNQERDVENVPLLSGGRGDTRHVTRVWRSGDRDVVLLQNGLPLNFDGDFETGTAASIDQTRALMYLGVAQALGALAPGLHPLSPDLQRRLAQEAGLALPKVSR